MLLKYIKIKALLWIFGTPRVFRYLPFLLGECCWYQQLWTHYQCGTRWSHLPTSGFGTTLRRTTSRCERCFCPDESWPASQAAFAAFASVCTASDLIQAGDLVTGGDVVGVVKENGPFGVRVLWWFLRTPSWAINVQRQMSDLERVQFPTVVLNGCVSLRCWGWCITHVRRKTGMGPWNPASWILLLGCKAGLILSWPFFLSCGFWTTVELVVQFYRTYSPDERSVHQFVDPFSQQGCSRSTTSWCPLESRAARTWGICRVWNLSWDDETRTNIRKGIRNCPPGVKTVLPAGKYKIETAVVEVEEAGHIWRKP